MSTKSIKEGWIIKRSKFLKQWRRRWLVLTSESLCSYKQPYPTAPTVCLPLSAITDAVPCEIELQRDFTFKVCGHKETVLIQAPNDKEMCS